MAILRGFFCTKTTPWKRLANAVLGVSLILYLFLPGSIIVLAGVYATNRHLKKRKG